MFHCIGERNPNTFLGRSLWALAMFVRLCGHFLSTQPTDVHLDSGPGSGWGIPELWSSSDETSLYRLGWVFLLSCWKVELIFIFSFLPEASVPNLTGIWHLMKAGGSSWRKTALEHDAATRLHCRSSADVHCFWNSNLRAKCSTGVLQLFFSKILLRDFLYVWCFSSNKKEFIKFAGHLVVVKWKCCQSSVATSLSLRNINQTFWREINMCDSLPTESFAVFLRSCEGKNSFKTQPGHRVCLGPTLQSAAAPHLFWIYWNYCFDQHQISFLLSFSLSAALWGPFIIQTEKTVTTP